MIIVQVLAEVIHSVKPINWYVDGEKKNDDQPKPAISTETQLRAFAR